MGVRHLLKIWGSKSLDTDWIQGLAVVFLDSTARVRIKATFLESKRGFQSQPVTHRKFEIISSTNPLTVSNIKIFLYVRCLTEDGKCASLQSTYLPNREE